MAEADRRSNEELEARARERPRELEAANAALRREVEERARTEAALRESEAKYRTLFNAIDDGFCIIEMLFDAAGRPVDFCYVGVNEGFARQTGRRPQPGQTMREVFPEAEDMWLEDY